MTAYERMCFETNVLLAGCGCGRNLCAPCLEALRAHCRDHAASWDEKAAIIEFADGEERRQAEKMAAVAILGSNDARVMQALRRAA